MWMHLANRAFLSGASAQKGVPDHEEQGIVVLSSNSKDDIDDNGDDDAAPETVHLINPSMNELMRAITTANQKPIIITQAAGQIGGHNSFMAIDDEALYEVEDEPQPDSLTFVRMLAGGQDRPNYYPHFVREICSNVVDPDYMRRALSLDDLHFVGVGGGGGDFDDNLNSNANNYDDVDDGSFFMEADFSSPTVMWRAYSEGALITMPGDRNLGQQMAILKGTQHHPQVTRKAGQNLMFTETTTDLAPQDTWSPGYWITMAHILMVITCHRWGL